MGDVEGINILQYGYLVTQLIAREEFLSQPSQVIRLVQVYSVNLILTIETV